MRRGRAAPEEMRPAWREKQNNQANNTRRHKGQQARYPQKKTEVYYDVSCSWQGWVSTIQSVVVTANVSQFYMYTKYSSMMSTHQLHLAKHQHHTHHADMIPRVSEVFRIKPLFQEVLFDFRHTQRPRWLFILERYKLYDHITTTQADMIRCTK